MVRGKGLNAQALSPTEIDNLKEQKGELESVLREKNEFGKGTSAEQIDETAIHRQINRLDKVINDQPRLSTRQKDEAYKRMVEIEERVQEGMPTRYEMDKPHKNPGAVRKHLDWSKRNAGSIEEYRNLKNLLGEHGRSIESLRKDR